MLIDEGLVLPCVRASIERETAQIAAGQVSYDATVRSALARFKGRFAHFTKQAYRLPTMLAVALADGGAAGGARGGGTAGRADWADATARTASVDLDALRDVAHPRVRAALRGPPQQQMMPPGLGIGAAAAPPEEPVASAAVDEEALIAEVRVQLESLGYAEQPKARKGKAQSRGGDAAGEAGAAGAASGGGGEELAARGAGGDGGGGDGGGGDGRKPRRRGRGGGKQRDRSRAAQAQQQS